MAPLALCCLHPERKTSSVHCFRDLPPRYSMHNQSDMNAQAYHYYHPHNFMAARPRPRASPVPRYSRAAKPQSQTAIQESSCTREIRANASVQKPNASMCVSLPIPPSAAHQLFERNPEHFQPWSSILPANRNRRIMCGNRADSQAIISSALDLFPTCVG